MLESTVIYSLGGMQDIIDNCKTSLLMIAGIKTGSEHHSRINAVHPFDIDLQLDPSSREFAEIGAALGANKRQKEILQSFYKKYGVRSKKTKPLPQILKQSLKMPSKAKKSSNPLLKN